MLTGLGSFVVAGISAPTRADAAGPQVTALVPVDSSFVSSSPDENPPHHWSSGNFAFDVASSGGGPRTVYARFANATGALQLTVGNPFEPCKAPNAGTAGVALPIDVRVDGVLLGRAFYYHLTSPHAPGDISNGDQIGTTITTTTGASGSSCWTGPHVHVELGLINQNSACYIAGLINQTVTATNALGVIGGGYVTGNNAACPPGATTGGGTPGAQEGQLLEATGDPSVYLIQDGHRLHVQSGTAVDCLGGYDDVHIVTATERDSFPLITDRAATCEGQMFRADGDPSVYLLEDGHRLYVPSDTVIDCLGGKEDLHVVAPTTRDAYPLANETAQCESQMFRAAGDPTVYFIQDGHRLDVQSDTTINCLGGKEDIHIITPAVRDSYPYTARAANCEGQMFRAEGDPSVYLVGNGQLHHVGNDATINCLGGKEDIHIVTGGTRDTFPVNAASPAACEGEMFRADGDPTVYLIRNGQRRHAQSDTVIACFGGYDHIHIVTAAVRDSFPVGNPASCLGDPPAAPTGLSAANSGAGVVVSWSDNAIDETGFDLHRVRYNPATATWGEPTDFTAPANATSFTDTNVANGQYAYQLRATNTAGSSAWVTATVVHSTATTAPATPTGLSGTSAGSNINVAWTDNATNELGYDIQRARWVAGVWSEWTSWPGDTNQATFTDTAVPDGFYAYLVRATNPIGPSNWAIAVIEHTTATTPPAAPSNLLLANQTSSVKLDWTDNSNSEHRFDVGRARYNPTTRTWGEWTFFVADRNTTTYTDTTPSDGQYAYLVRAINPNGPSDWTISVTTHTNTTTPPAAPTNLTAASAGGNVTLTWTDNATNEVFYELQRTQLINGTWTNWTSTTLDKNTTTHNDISVPPGHYAYLLRTTNPNGNSTWTTTETNVA